MSRIVKVILIYHCHKPVQIYTYRRFYLLTLIIIIIILFREDISVFILFSISTLNALFSVCLILHFYSL
jgi:hypothetical protein